MDEDLERLTREQLLEEVKRLRAGIREHVTVPATHCAGIILNCGIFCQKNLPPKLQYRPGLSSSVDACVIGNRWTNKHRMRQEQMMNLKAWTVYDL